MPRICAFFGIVIRMFYNDHRHLISTPSMASTKLSMKLRPWRSHGDTCPVVPMPWSWNGRLCIVPNWQPTGIEPGTVCRYEILNHWIKEREVLTMGQLGRLVRVQSVDPEKDITYTWSLKMALKG